MAERVTQVVVDRPDLRWKGLSRAGAQRQSYSVQGSHHPLPYFDFVERLLFRPHTSHSTRPRFQCALTRTFDAAPLALSHARTYTLSLAGDGDECRRKVSTLPNRGYWYDSGPTSALQQWSLGMERLSSVLDLRRGFFRHGFLTPGVDARAVETDFNSLGYHQHTHPSLRLPPSEAISRLIASLPEAFRPVGPFHQGTALFQQPPPTQFSCSSFPLLNSSISFSSASRSFRPPEVMGRRASRRSQRSSPPQRFAPPSGTASQPPASAGGYYGGRSGVHNFKTGVPAQHPVPLIRHVRSTPCLAPRSPACRLEITLVSPARAWVRWGTAAMSYSSRTHACRTLRAPVPVAPTPARTLVSHANPLFLAHSRRRTHARRACKIAARTRARRAPRTPTPGAPNRVVHAHSHLHRAHTLANPSCTHAYRMHARRAHARHAPKPVARPYSSRTPIRPAPMPAARTPSRARKPAARRPIASTSTAGPTPRSVCACLIRHAHILFAHPPPVAHTPAAATLIAHANLSHARSPRTLTCLARVPMLVARLSSSCTHTRGARKPVRARLLLADARPPQPSCTHARRARTHTSSRTQTRRTPTPTPTPVVHANSACVLVARPRPSHGHWLCMRTHAYRAPPHRGRKTPARVLAHARRTDTRRACSPIPIAHPSSRTQNPARVLVAHPRPSHGHSSCTHASPPPLVTHAKLPHARSLCSSTMTLFIVGNWQVGGRRFLHLMRLRYEVLAHYEVEVEV
ncbi:hypothetical protein K438DRAFT_2141630 [Mycena galopus ATCC 62051]|nr:hypothetical protein K438DRAFT_2141630 [Mycena galopus ATCC 62051]